MPRGTQQSEPEAASETRAACFQSRNAFTLQVTELGAEEAAKAVSSQERSQDAPGPAQGCPPWTLHRGAWHRSNTEALRRFEKHLVMRES